MVDVVGLQTFADGGRIQVDTNNRTMLMLKSGQFTINNSTAASGAWINELANITGRMTAATIMCYHAPNHGIHPTIGAYRNGNKLVNFTYLKGTSITFQYYIFDNMQPSLTSRLGLQSFDERGNLIYDAMDYPMKIMEMVASEYYDATHRVVYTAPHSNIAVGCLSGGGTVQFYEQDSESRSLYMYIQGTQVVQWGLYDPNPEGWVSIPQFGSYGTNRMNSIVIDTTNLPKNYLRP